MKKILIAPIAGVTDYTYRGILEKFNPDMIFTEMVSVNALSVLNDKTLSKILRLREGNAVQIFGEDVEKVIYSVKFLNKNGIKHIDLNCGCPMKKIVDSGYGAALVKSPDKIKRILSVMKENVNDDVDISLKIRIGYNEPENYLEIAKIAEELNCKHITVHGRTRSQLYSGTSDWKYVKEIKEKISIPVIGNGDIFDAEDAERKIKYSNVDGIMLARGIFGNPWLITQIREILEYGYVKTVVTETDRINMAIEHVEKTMDENQEKEFIYDIRKHICWYLKGVKNSSYAKNNINKMNNYIDVLQELKKLKENL